MEDPTLKNSEYDYNRDKSRIENRESRIESIFSQTVGNQMGVPYMNRVNYVSLRKLNKLKRKIRFMAIVSSLIFASCVLLD